MRVDFASNFDLQIAVHSIKESSRRLTLTSSERCSSNAETAGTKLSTIVI